MSFPRYPAYKDSGVEWLGEVPEHWEVYRFRRLFRESAEKVVEEIVGCMLSVSGYRGIEVKEYDDENRRRTDQELLGYRIVRRGQLVVNTMWLNYAGLGVSDYEGYVSPAYRSYWIDETMNLRFTHHLVRSEIYVQGYTRLLTGIRPNSLQMSREDLMDFPILRPPPSDQAPIAVFLDCETAKIDALIEEQRRLIELLKEKRQAVISHTVTKGLDPHVAMKPSGVEWLGEVPAHWTVLPLKRFWSVLDCKHVTAEFVDEGIPVASIREVQSQYVDLTNARNTTEPYYEILTEGGRKPQGGDLIFSRNATVGEVAQVTEEHPVFAMGQDVCLLRRSSGNASSDFLQVVIRSPVVVEQLAIMMIGSTFKRINVEEIRNLMIPFPPYDEQLAISNCTMELASEMESLTAEAERAIALLQERRTALISAAVTGKIDVRGLAEAA